MSRPLRILLIEDDPCDAELVLDQIRSGGFEPLALRVDNASDMRSALARGIWDVILADYHLPSFGAPAAMSVLRESGIDLPFVVVTGTIGEEHAAGIMRLGAHDFVLKDRLSRLASAIERALGDARARAERRQALSDLEVTNAELTTLVAASPVAIFALAPDGRVQRWNRAAEVLFGWSAQEVLGQPVPSACIGAEAKFTAMREHALHGESFMAVELRMAHKDGRPLDVAVSMAPLPNPTAESHGILVLGCDMTERRQLERMLHQSQKLESVGRLASGIAHEINTPMQFIGDNAKFLTDAFADLQPILALGRAAVVHAPDADRATFDAAVAHVDLAWLLKEMPISFAHLQDGIVRVAQIVKAMKEFAHPGSDEPTPADINHAIESTLAVSRSAWKYVADVETALDPDLPPVPVVLGGFNQVMLNLVVNAAHAIEDAHGSGKGTISIRTRRGEGHAIVEVSDTGCGMTSAVRQHLFEPFFTTKGIGRGTGQGLSLVRSEIMDRLGGRVEVDSAPGAGCTFRLFIPLQRNVPS